MPWTFGVQSSSMVLLMSEISKRSFVDFCINLFVVFCDFCNPSISVQSVLYMHTYMHTIEWIQDVKSVLHSKLKHTSRSDTRSRCYTAIIHLSPSCTFFSNTRHLALFVITYITWLALEASRRSRDMYEM